MQHRKYIGIGVTVVLVAVILLIFLEPWNTLQREGRKILLQESSGVDLILISDKYDSVSLVKIEDDWFLGEIEPVNLVAVENLLYASGKLQIGSVSSDLPDLDPGLVRRVIYCDGEKILLQFEAISSNGRFMVRPHGSQSVFGVTLPGYAGLDLSTVFSNHANHYRKHMLVDLLPSEIQFVEVTRKGEEPFRFTMDDEGEIGCTLPLSDSIVPSSLLDELSVRLLFSYFTSIRYEDLAMDVLQDYGTGVDYQRWIARLNVESRTGVKNSLDVYTLPGEEGTESNMFQAIVIHNDDPRLLVVNYIYLDVLMRKLDSYLAPGGS